MVNLSKSKGFGLYLRQFLCLMLSVGMVLIGFPVNVAAQEVLPSEPEYIGQTGNLIFDCDKAPGRIEKYRKLIEGMDRTGAIEKTKNMIKILEQESREEWAKVEKIQRQAPIEMITTFASQSLNKVRVASNKLIIEGLIKKEKIHRLHDLTSKIEDAANAIIKLPKSTKAGVDGGLAHQRGMKYLKREIFELNKLLESSGIYEEGAQAAAAKIGGPVAALAFKAALISTDLLVRTELAWKSSYVANQLQGNLKTMEQVRDKFRSTMDDLKTFQSIHCKAPKTPTRKTVDKRPGMGSAENERTDHFRLFQTIEYLGTESQFRMQLTEISKWMVRKAKDVAQYELNAQAALRLGNHEELVALQFDPRRIERDLRTESLTGLGETPELLAKVMNIMIHQVKKGERRKGHWEETVTLGLSEYLPEKLTFTFYATPLNIKGLPDALSLAVFVKPFTFRIVGRGDGKEVTCLLRSVFVSSPLKDQLYQAGAAFTAVHGKEMLRIEHLQFLSDPEGKKALYPVVDLREFLKLSSKPMKVKKEGRPPFWTFQAIKAFQIAHVAGATVGERRTNSSNYLWNAADTVWGFGQQAAELAAAMGKVPYAKELAEAMKEVHPSAEAKRHLAKFIGQDAVKGLDAILLGVGYVTAVAGITAVLAGAAFSLGTVGNIATLALGVPYGVHELSKYLMEEEVQYAAIDYDDPWPRAREEVARKRPPRVKDSTGLVKAPKGTWVKEHPYIAAASAVGAVAVVAGAGGDGGNGAGGGGGDGNGDGGDGNGDGGSSCRGSASGSWSGICKTRYGNYTVRGRFSASVSSSGAVSGSYSGSDAGRISGSVDSSCTLSAGTSGGSLSGRWRGTLRPPQGSGSWTASGTYVGISANCNGTWSAP